MLFYICSCFDLGDQFLPCVCYILEQALGNLFQWFFLSLWEYLLTFVKVLLTWTVEAIVTTELSIHRQTIILFSWSATNSVVPLVSFFITVTGVKGHFLHLFSLIFPVAPCPLSFNFFINGNDVKRLSKNILYGNCLFSSGNDSIFFNTVAPHFPYAFSFSLFPS